MASKTTVVALSVLAIGLAIGLAAGQAGAAMILEYEGTIRVNSGYYGHGLAYVADGVGSGDRPVSVTGPTLVTVGGHGSTDYIKEWYIPTPVTSGTAPTATQVATAAGGTYVDDTQRIRTGWGTLAVVGGTIWGLPQNDDATSNYGFGMVKLGTNEDWVDLGNTGITRLQSIAGAGGYSGGGIANKFDETDTMVIQEWDYATGGFDIYINKAVKGAGGVGGDPDVYSWTVSNRSPSSRTASERWTWNTSRSKATSTTSSAHRTARTRPS